MAVAAWTRSGACGTLKRVTHTQPVRRLSTFAWFGLVFLVAGCSTASKRTSAEFLQWKESRLESSDCYRIVAVSTHASQVLFQGEGVHRPGRKAIIAYRPSFELDTQAKDPEEHEVLFEEDLRALHSALGRPELCARLAPRADVGETPWDESSPDAAPFFTVVEVLPVSRAPKPIERISVPARPLLPGKDRESVQQAKGRKTKP